MVTFKNIRHEKKMILNASRKKSRIKNRASSKLVLEDKMENFKYSEGNLSR